MKLEIGKKYTCRDRKDIKYVEVTSIDIMCYGRIQYDDGEILSAYKFNSNGSVFYGNATTLDLIAEYQEDTMSNASETSKTRGQEILDKIDNMKSICADGKKEVRELVKVLLPDVDFEEKPKEQVFYLNMYKEGTAPCSYKGKAAADKGAGCDRLACIKTKVTWKEGQFDD